MRKFIVILLLIAGTLVESCQKEEFSFDEQKSILMSTGWKLDRFILHFQDNRKDEVSDTLVLITSRSDMDEQEMTVYTGWWIIFANDTIALSAFNINYYTRPDEQHDWESYSKNNTIEGWTDWGPDADGILHLSLLKEWPIRLRLANEKKLILEDAYQLEIVDDMPGAATITNRFGTYPPGTLESIDAVYLAAGPDEGPNWVPSWRFWPSGFSLDLSNMENEFLIRGTKSNH